MKRFLIIVIVLFCCSTAQAQKQCFDQFVLSGQTGSLRVVPCPTPTPQPTPSPSPQPSPTPQPTPGTVQITVNKQTSSPGGSVTVTIANGPANVQDWLGVFVVGSPSTTPAGWVYLNGSSGIVPPTGISNATIAFKMPLIVGTYEFRLLVDNTYTVVAVSPRIAVSGSTPSPTPQPTATPVPTPVPTPSPVPSPSPTPIPGAAFYVAVNGSPSGDGSAAKPWDLQTLLNQPASVKPGASIVIDVGLYPGKWISKLTGTAAAPITVVFRDGAKLDGNVSATLAAPLAVTSPFAEVPISLSGATPGLTKLNGASAWIEQSTGNRELVAYHGNSGTVLRGWGGTTVFAHAAGAALYFPDNVLTINGSYTNYVSPELLDSWPVRAYPFDFKNTTIPIRSGGAVVNGQYVKIINPFIHDTSTGIYANEGAVGLEVYGGIGLNVGFVDFSRGHGQWLYLANNPTVQKKVRNSIVSGGFSDCFKTYTSSGHASNVLVENFIASNCGVLSTFPGNKGDAGVDFPASYRESGFFVGANGANKATNDIFVRKSYFYFPLNTDGASPLRMGYFEGVGSLNLEVSDSVIAGGATPVSMTGKTFKFIGNKVYAQASGGVSNGKLLIGARLDSGYSGTWNNNQYFDETPGYPFLLSSGGVFKLACNGGAQLKFTESCAPKGGWQQTGFDANSTYTLGSPTKNEVYPIPNDYEAGRYHVAIYNWEKLPTVNVPVALADGDRVEARIIEDFWNPLTLTVSGGVVSISMTGLNVATAIGMAWTPPSTRPIFASVLIKKLP